MKRLTGFLAGLILLASAVWPAAAQAAAPAPAATGNFNLQVSPSPLVTTVKPGVKTQLPLQIRNNGSGTEYLQIEPRDFSFDSKTGKVSLHDTVSPTFSSWVTFSAPKFTILSGQTLTEQVVLNPPKDAGFSYSFALVINRQNNPVPEGGTRAINGSLAVFTLVNIDRPDAKSNLEVTSFTVSKKLYEYLPTSLSVRFNNTGNTIAQPSGNIFIEHGGKTPLATLAVNKTQGYILPGTQRMVTASWDDGFPVYRAVTGSGGKVTQKLAWNWGDLSKLRIGRYTAHLVAVYSQGGRDVPIEGTVSFWVVPWKILLGLLIVVLLILLALFVLVRAAVRFVRRRILRHKTPPTSETPQAGT